MQLTETMRKARAHLAFGIVFIVGALVSTAFTILDPDVGWSGLGILFMCAIFGFIFIRSAFRLHRSDHTEH